MGRYAVKRILWGFVTIWMVTLTVFLIIRITGDPIQFLANPAVSSEDRERMRQDFGLDQPIYIQYLLYNKGIFTGNFGMTIRWTGRTPLEVVMMRAPATIQLVGASLVFSMVLGLFLGVISATMENSIFDRIARVVAIIGQSMPGYWLGLLLILLFTIYLGWLPSAGGLDRVGIKGIIMPTISLGWFLVAANTRLTRSTMLEVLNSDYIRMLRANGIPRLVIIWKHALRNASLPVITLFAYNFTFVIGSTLITEAIFSWPGIGLLMVNSIFARDYAIVQTVVFFSAIAIVLVNILVDISYAWLDPRVRLTNKA